MRLPRIRRRWAVAGALVAVVGLLFLLFPGRRLLFAFTIAYSEWEE